MSILILNRTSYSKIQYDVWLEELDQKLIMLTTPERAHECYGRYPIVEGFENYETTGSIEIRAYELNDIYSFHTVIAASEFDILRAGSIRNTIGIKGQSYESAIAFRDKLVMKEYIKQAGFETPHFTELRNATDLYQFTKTFGFPVVVKPIDGSGSEDTHVIRNYHELVAFVRLGIRPHMEVESFVEGTMYHIDGLVLDGKVVFSWPSRYVNGCLAFQDSDYNGSYLLDKANPITDRLNQYVKDILQALPTPEITSFHAEVFHTPDDRLIFCEIASRTGGGMIRDTIYQGFGVDLLKLSIQAQCGIKVKLPSEPDWKLGPSISGGFVMIPARKGTVLSISNEWNEEWIAKSVISAKEGQRFERSGSSVDTIASFLLKGDSAGEVLKHINDVGRRFEESIQWQEEQH